MTQKHFTRSLFDNFVIKLLLAEEYKIEQIEPSNNKGFRPDIVAISKAGERKLIEIKSYSSARGIPMAVLMSAVEQLQKYSAEYNASKCIIITTADFGEMTQLTFEQTNIELWDYYLLVKLVRKHPDLAEEFSQIIGETQPFKITGASNDEKIRGYFNTYKTILTGEYARQFLNKGSILSEKLSKIPEGKEGSILFEEQCFDALSYLFQDHLSAWKTQSKTNGGLHRFDLIARVSSSHDFWNALVSHWRGKYIVFEFKNYSKPIGQNQIYGTEKYLYPSAMRSAAIIIARKGANKNAQAAARGALRELGKVILTLSLKQLSDMLIKKDQGEEPTDILSEMLDDMMMSIER